MRLDHLSHITLRGASNFESNTTGNICRHDLQEILLGNITHGIFHLDVFNFNILHVFKIICIQCDFNWFA